MDALVLVVDLHPVQPFGCIHEMILCDVEWEAIDGGHVEHIRNGLVVFVIGW